MNKLVYLVSAPKNADAAAFAARVRGELAPGLLGHAPAGLKLDLTEPELPRPWHLPTSRAPLALVSLWSAGDDAAAWSARLAAWGLPFVGYRVRESTPRAYVRDWPDGAATPGIGMVTLFRRRKGLSQEEFLHRWLEGHGPIALATHPLWNYLRNVVEAPLTDAAPPWAGIVEEHFREEVELTDPRHFFGSALKIVPGIVHVLWQTNTFLDLFTLRNHIYREYWLRTPTGR